METFYSSVARREFEHLIASMTTVPINVPVVHAFIALNILGGVGMLIVLTTAILSRNVKRLSTWYSFAGSWILSCISYSLLTFAGQQLRPDPLWWLCFTQTALIYAVPPTTACTTLSLLVHILLSFPDPKADSPVKINLPTTFLLLMGPYTVFIVIFTGVSLYSTRDPASLQKSARATYCISSNPAWLRVSSIVVAVVSVMIIIVQGQLAARLYANYRSPRRSSRSFVTMIRVTLFTLIGFVTLVVAMIFSVANGSDAPDLAFDMILAFFPLLALLVFGSQKDLCQVWISKFYRHAASGTSGIRESMLYGRKHPVGGV